MGRQWGYPMVANHPRSAARDRCEDSRERPRLSPLIGFES
jgi:hypothetical protein